MQPSLPNDTRWKTPFFSIWSAQAVSMAGSRIAQFALVWWLTEESRSATVLATATLVAILPGIILGPIVGALVDRWERRRVLIAADSLIALISVWLAVLFWRDTVTVGFVYAAMFARGVGEAFHWPAMQASTTLMVPERQLSRVAGMNQTLRGTLSVASPPLGALLMGLLPLHSIMGIDVLTAAIAIAPLFFIAIPQPKTDGSSAGFEPSVWQDMISGLRYVWNWSGLVIILGIAMIINFIVNPAFSLMPLLVTDHFAGGATELGWLQSAYGVGMILGGLLLSAWGGFRRRVHTSLMGLVIGGLGIMGVGIAPAGELWFALMSLFVAGFMNPLINGPLYAVLQSSVAPEMQGRVFTLISSLSTAMMPISLAVAGPVADAVGIRTWYVAGGAVFSIMGAVTFLVPAVTHLEDSPPGDRVEPCLAESG